MPKEQCLAVFGGVRDQLGAHLVAPTRSTNLTSELKHAGDFLDLIIRLDLRISPAEALHVFVAQCGLKNDIHRCFFEGALVAPVRAPGCRRNRLEARQAVARARLIVLSAHSFLWGRADLFGAEIVFEEEPLVPDVVAARHVVADDTFVQKGERLCLLGRICHNVGRDAFCFKPLGLAAAFLKLPRSDQVVECVLQLRQTRIVPWGCGCGCGRGCGRGCGGVRGARARVPFPAAVWYPADTEAHLSGQDTQCRTL